MHTDDSIGCLVSIALIVLSLCLMAGINMLANSATEEEWNHGVCPKDNVRYELRAAGYYDKKYYACPQCGMEVCRYGD